MSDGGVGLSVVILAVSWGETGLGLFFFTLRLISTMKFARLLRWDFALSALTVVIETTAQACLQVSVNAGMGSHIDTLSPENLVVAIKWGWAFQLLAIAASMMGKLTITAFLMQIRGRHEKKPWFLIILAGLIICVNFTVFGTILGQCQPVRKLWDDSVPGTCDPGRKNNQNYSFFQASFNSFADAALASYPIHLFWKLQMKLRLKIALSILMGFGWIAAACSAVKTAQLQDLTKTTDITYALSTLLIWASTEAWIIIIVSCIPPIRPLLDGMLQSFGLTKKSASSYPQSGPRKYAVPRTDDSRLKSGSRFQYQTRAYGPSNRAGRLEDGSWIELAGATDMDETELVVPDEKSTVRVTTDIETSYEHRQKSRSASRSESNEVEVETGGRPNPTKIV